MFLKITLALMRLTKQQLSKLNKCTNRMHIFEEYNFFGFFTSGNLKKIKSILIQYQMHSLVLFLTNK